MWGRCGTDEAIKGHVRPWWDTWLSGGGTHEVMVGHEAPSGCAGPCWAIVGHDGTRGSVMDTWGHGGTHEAIKGHVRPWWDTWFRDGHRRLWWDTWFNGGHVSPWWDS